jgi:flagellar motor switch protein FliN/FliY
MSDGALSQDEIDALLSGTGGDTPGPAGGPAPAAAGGSEEDRQAFQKYLAGNTGAESATLSMLTGAEVKLQEPQVGFTNRDTLLNQFPDTVTVIKADFNSGFPGEHLFVLPEDTAKKIASLMNKEENIEMDEMAMSVIGEAFSNLVGTQITDLTKKTNNKSIANIAPQTVNVKKATAALPAGDFLNALYQLDLGDGVSHQIWEIYGGSVASDIAKALNGGAVAAPAMNTNAGMAAVGMNAGMQGMSMPAMGMQGMGMGGMQMQGMGGMQGMSMQGMGGGMGMHGMAGVGAPANVQAVQFPNLMSHASPQEAGNIGLIMDVSMEMTVELGRTKKLIKEILSMGEGTIIELDKLAGEPVDILVNHKLIAKGEVVVIDENFGVRVTEIVSPQERMTDMG